MHKEQTFAMHIPGLRVGGHDTMREESSRIYLNRIRRKRRLHRRVLIIAITLCLSFGAGIVGTCFLSRAQAAGQPAASYKYFTSIIVNPGDTLTTIAGQYADSHYESVEAYIEEVRMTNHLRDEDIRAGEYLIVPYYSSEFR